MNNYDLLL